MGDWVGPGIDLDGSGTDSVVCSVVTPGPGAVSGSVGLQVISRKYYQDHGFMILYRY